MGSLPTSRRSSACLEDDDGNASEGGSFAFENPTFDLEFPEQIGSTAALAVSNDGVASHQLQRKSELSGQQELECSTFRSPGKAENEITWSEVPDIDEDGPTAQ
jgi:hypothetical protein